MRLLDVTIRRRVEQEQEPETTDAEPHNNTQEASGSPVNGSANPSAAEEDIFRPIHAGLFMIHQR